MHLSSCVLGIVLPSAAFSLSICVAGAHGSRSRDLQLVPPSSRAEFPSKNP